MSDTSNRAPARLRGHHLFCLRTYRGEGYPASFAANISEVLGRLEKGEAIVVEGPDDVCVACPDLCDGACIHDVGDSSEIRRLDRLALGLLGLVPSDTVRYADVLRWLPTAWGEWSASACAPCEYADYCARRQ